MNIPPLPSHAREIFNAQVWEIARQIPPGKVATYGQIAALIPAPPDVDAEHFSAYRARWAGQAMAACPADVPWQRVINSQGKISFRPGQGTPLQRALLEDEGVAFDDRERVDLKRFGWGGPPREWLQARGLLFPEDEGYHQDTLF